MMQSHPPDHRRLLLLVLEVRLFLRQRFVTPTLIAFAGICFLAAADGMHRIALQRETVHRLAEVEQQRLTAAGKLAILLDRKQATAGPFRDPRIPSNFVRLVLSTAAVKPLLPAAAIDANQADILPFYFLLNTAAASKTTTAYEFSNPQQFVLGRFDLSLVLIYILPLFMVLLGYRIGSFEREAGMVRPLRIASPALPLVYARRLLLATLPPAALYLTIATALCCVESYFDHSGTAMLAHSIVALLALVTLYSCFWIAVLLPLALTSATSATALLRASMAWLTVCILMPACAAQLAASLYPTMPRPEYVNRLRAANDAMIRDPQKLYHLYLTHHPDRDTAYPPGTVPNASSMTLITAEATDLAAKDLDAEIQTTRVRQERIVRSFSSVCPALLLQKQLDELAGEDQERQEAFLSHAQEHIQKLRDFYREAVKANALLAPVDFKHLLQYPRFQSATR